MNLEELEENLIKTLAKSANIDITIIECVSIIEIFRMGIKPFKEKYPIFFMEVGK